MQHLVRIVTRIIGTMLLAAFGCGMIGGIAVLMVQITTLSCARSQTGSVDCAVETKSWNLLSRRSKTVHGLKTASVESSRCANEEDMCGICILLTTAEGQLPLNEGDGGDMSSMAVLQNDARRINELLKDPNARAFTVLLSSVDWLPPVVWCGMALLVLGGGIMALLVLFTFIGGFESVPDGRTTGTCEPDAGPARRAAPQ